MDMDFEQDIRRLALRINREKDDSMLEAATKTAFVLPWIQVLGYDIFDPREVVPEFTVDIGIRRGEKVDYAIMQQGIPIMLIECKPCKATLENESLNQIWRYFNASRAKIAILTNGSHYYFYTDLEETNRMDQLPFLKLDILNLSTSDIEDLKYFSKNKFNLSEIINNSQTKRYLNGVKDYLRQQLKIPTEDFVRFCARAVYQGRVTDKVILRFTSLVERAFKDLFGRSRLVEDIIGNSNSASVDEESIDYNNLKNRILSKLKFILSSLVDGDKLTIRDMVFKQVILLHNRILFHLSLHINGTHSLILGRNEDDIIKFKDLSELDGHADVIREAVALKIGVKQNETIQK